MATVNAVKPGHHESGELATMENPIHQLGGSAGRSEHGVIVGMDGKHITHSVDGGARLIRQEIGSIENADKLRVGQVVEINHDTNKAWTGRPEYTAKVIERPELSEDKIQEIVSAGSSALRTSMAGIRDERIVVAINADREKLDLMERSFAKDHPQQVAIGRARLFVEAVELADIEKRKTLELGGDDLRDIKPAPLQQTQRTALELAEKTLKAAESAGIDVRHELKHEWNHPELHKQHENGGLEHGE